MPPPPRITEDDVRHLARLARLVLTDDETVGYAAQLSAILDHVASIQAVRTDGAEPGGPVNGDLVASSVAGASRADVVAPSLSQDEALAAAPSVADGRFAVPQILGEEQ